MSTTPNAFGTALGTSAPFMGLSAIGTPFGQFIKPGGRVAAYVRSTGFQDLDDNLVRDNLVTTLNEGLKRCRSGLNDIVYVLPGHTETYSTSGAVWANLVAGAQIVGCGLPGATNAPTLNLTQAGASIALNVANVSLIGMNIVGGVATATASIVVTGAGVTIAGCFLNFGGFALGANSPIAVTGAATFSLVGNNIVADSTSTMVAITGAASTNFLIQGNVARQAQGTGGGGFSSTASTAGISGHYADNYFKTATTSVGGAGVIVLGAATITTVGNHQNFGGDETAAQSLIVTGA